MQGMQSTYQTSHNPALAVACLVIPLTVLNATVSLCYSFQISLPFPGQKGKVLGVQTPLFDLRVYYSQYGHFYTHAHCTYLSYKQHLQTSLQSLIQRSVGYNLKHPSTSGCKQMWKVRRTSHRQLLMYCIHILGTRYEQSEKRKRLSTTL